MTPETVNTSRHRDIYDLAPKTGEAYTASRKFFARHPFAVYNRHGAFHSRFASLACAAGTVIYNNERPSQLGQGSYVINEVTGDIYDYAQLHSILNHRAMSNPVAL